jgi:hypothetical protein
MLLLGKLCLYFMRICYNIKVVCGAHFFISTLSNEVKESKTEGQRSPGVFIPTLSNEVKESKTEGLEVPEFLFII